MLCLTLPPGGLSWERFIKIKFKKYFQGSFPADDKNLMKSQMNHKLGLYMTLEDPTSQIQNVSIFRT